MSNLQTIPRLVLAGVSSGVGKTTTVVALATALRSRGLRVAVFKCGPDYLDPTYHRRASGRAVHNLDGWMMGRQAVLDTFARATVGADVALIEGVMGLFDGASPSGEAGSTAEIAKWLQAPVVLVADAGGMARSIAALVQGYAGFDSELRLAGAICNRVGSAGHLDLLRKALHDPPILGGFPKLPELSFPERHLGLLTADNAVPGAVFAGWGEQAETWLDLDAMHAIARSAPPLDGGVVGEVRQGADSRVCRIGLAEDEAFHFYYEDNLARLEQSGAELVRFSPVHDRALPDVDGLYLGGGYPEVSAEALSRNQAMQQSVRAFAASGAPIYAECGGLMYLTRAIRTLDGRRHPMVGLVPGEAVLQERLQALGYVEVEIQHPTFLGGVGTRFRGHQFRYSELAELGDAEHSYTVRRRRGNVTFGEGYRLGNVLASYVHAHWASNPQVANNFVSACAAFREASHLGATA